MVNLYPHHCTPPHFLFFLLLTHFSTFLSLNTFKNAQASYLLVNTKFPLHGTAIQPLFE